MRVVNASFCCEALCDFQLRKVLYKLILLTYTSGWPWPNLSLSLSLSLSLTHTHTHTHWLIVSI